MADLPVLPVTNFGTMLSSYGEGLATQEQATTANLNAQANVSQLPYQRSQIQAQTQNTQAQTAAANLANEKQQIALQWMASMVKPPIVNDQQAIPAGGAAGTDAANTPTASSSNPSTDR
jgi:hypothetical protein